MHNITTNIVNSIITIRIGRDQVIFTAVICVSTSRKTKGVLRVMSASILIIVLNNSTSLKSIKPNSAHSIPTILIHVIMVSSVRLLTLKTISLLNSFTILSMMMIFTCSISKLFGVLSTLLNMIKHYAFMHITGKIIDVNQVSSTMNQLPVIHGVLLIIF